MSPTVGHIDIYHPARYCVPTATPPSNAPRSMCPSYPILRDASSRARLYPRSNDVGPKGREVAAIDRGRAVHKHWPI
jgi:hypothetical protein